MVPRIEIRLEAISVECEPFWPLIDTVGGLFGVEKATVGERLMTAGGRSRVRTVLSLAAADIKMTCAGPAIRRRSPAQLRRGAGRQ